jgi:WD40 repeat protein
MLIFDIISAGATLGKRMSDRGGPIRREFATIVGNPAGRCLPVVFCQALAKLMKALCRFPIVCSVPDRERMSPSESASGLVLDLAEEFLGRYRQGERPSLREYTDRHPELEAEIREVFPAMAMLENIALASESGGSGPRNKTASNPQLQQLGDYRIIREVGRGGMGVVYEAEQVSLGRRVALKVLPPQVRDGKQRRRFEREARAAAKLHHTNIVPIFGVGEHDGQPYYVMQFIQGLGLDVVLLELKRLSRDAPTAATTFANVPGVVPGVAADGAVGSAPGSVPASPGREPGPHACPVIAAPAPPGGSAVIAAVGGEPAAPSASSTSSSGALSLLSSSAALPGQGGNSGVRQATYWQSVAQIGIQVASALEHAHNQGVVHRDIKPSNLLLDADGAVWVTDFGLAKAEGQQDLTHTGDVLGTVRYMPPEALDGRADARGDVYSLGLTLYELVALRRAFEAKDRNQLVKQVTMEEPRRLERLAPGVPRDLATIVHTAIAKEPARRYQTAGELAADLQRFAEDRPIRARHIGAAERMWRWSRRNPLVASLAAAVVLSLFAGAAVSTVLGINATLARDRADASAREAIDNANKVTQERNKALAEKDRADHEADAARASLYVVRLNAVQMALENSNVALALDLLKQTQLEREAAGESMAWEWRHHWRSCHGALRKLAGHSGEIAGLAVCPDGTRLISLSNDGTLREWDSATGQQLRSLRFKGFTKSCLALNAEGTRLAVGSQAGVVKILDAVTWQELHHFQAHNHAVRGLAFSPDGVRLATASDDQTLKTWSVAAAQELRTFIGHTDKVYSVAFSPDGQSLASGSADFTVRIWNASLGQVVHTLRGATAAVVCVAFSPDGRQLASAGRDWVVRIWDATKGGESRTMTGHTSEVRTLAFSPDGAVLASSGFDRTVKFWNVANRRELASYVGHQAGVYCMGFSPDGRWLASGSSDATIRVWRTVRELGSRTDKSHTDQVRAVEFSPDGRSLASVGLDGRIIVRDVVTGQGKDLANGTALGLLGLAYSPDGRSLATAGHGGMVTVWDTVTGQVRFRVQAHTSWSSSLAFSPDGAILASGGHDRAIKLLDAATGQTLHTIEDHGGEITGLIFSADGRRLFSGCIDRSIKTWDVHSGGLLQTFNGHTEGVTCIALSRDNRRLASTSHDRTVKVWDVTSGDELHTMRGHNETVWCVRFIGNGDRLITAGWDQSVRVWDARTGFEVAQLKGHSDRVLGVAVSPDGGRVAAAGGRDLSVRVWDGRPLDDANRLEGEAANLVDFLFTRPLPKADVIAYLNSAPSLRAPVRELAIELAEHFGDDADAQAFHDAAWRLLKHPHANAAMAQFALAQMSAACERDPENLQYRRGLAAAQYRLGRFQKEFLSKAATTLKRCDSNEPVTGALRAMTRHQLGEQEAARAALASVRLIMQSDSDSHPDAAAFLREAEMLIEGVR